MPLSYLLAAKSLENHYHWGFDRLRVKINDKYDVMEGFFWSFLRQTLAISCDFVAVINYYGEEGQKVSEIVLETRFSPQTSPLFCCLLSWTLRILLPLLLASYSRRPNIQHGPASLHTYFSTPFWAGTHRWTSEKSLRRLGLLQVVAGETQSGQWDVIDGKNMITQLVAKPRGTEGYCSICKDDYDDYLQVSSLLHSTSINNLMVRPSERISSMPTSMN